MMLRSSVEIFLVILIALPGFASWAQSDLSSFDIDQQPDLYSSEEHFEGISSKGMIWNNSDKFQTLQRPLRVEIPRGARGVSHPSFLNGEGGLTVFRSRYECNYTNPMSGDLLYVKDGVAAVRLDSHQGCQSGKLNSSSEAKDVVFFKTNQVESTGEYASTASNWDDSDSQTEAGLDQPQNPSSHKGVRGDIDPVLDAMITEYAAKQKKADSPFNHVLAKTLKGRDEMAVFMQVNCTPHQPDFKLVYEKLIHLSEKSFTLAYYPDSKRTEKFDEKNNPFNSQEGGRGTDIPAVVRPEPLAISCIARRESRWDKNARSPTGAVGVGQQTSTNVEDLKCFVYGCGKQKPKEWARKAWDEYHDRAEKDFPRSEYPQLYQNTVTGKSCDRKLDSKEQVGFCPISSVGGIALYQVIVEQDIYRVNDSFTRDALTAGGDGLSSGERLELLEVLATSHNSGRTVARLAAEGQKTKNWADTISKMRGTDRGDGGKEVRDYHKIMENCLESGADMNFAHGDGMAQCRNIVNKRNFKSQLGLADRIMQKGESEEAESSLPSSPSLQKIPIPGRKPIKTQR